MTVCTTHDRGAQAMISGRFPRWSALVPSRLAVGAIVIKD
jgi:hypothetical protein